MALGAETTAPSLILLFSPSVPEGRQICKLHCLCKAIPDKMKTLRENAHTKRNPSSISKPIVQIWGKKSEHAGGDQKSEQCPLCVSLCTWHRAPAGRQAMAGSVPQDALRCPAHNSHGGSFKLLFPSPSSPSLVLPLHIRRQRAKC